MPLDVQPDHLTIVQNILRRHIPNHRVLAFGSRAKGTVRESSDLDLCVIGNEALSFELLGNLRDEFSLSNLPYKVDVIDWTAIAPDFRQIILSSNIEIQKLS